MTTNLDTVIKPRPEPKRDQWGRYLIKPADGGKARAHTRATTWAGTIDDKEGLIGWSARVAMLGVARRPDLYALACAAKTDAELKPYVDEAKDAGGASYGRNVGSALHAFTERIDLGEDVAVPQQWQPDIDAYREALTDAGLRPVPHLIERVCVVPEFDVAGMFDRCYVNGDGELFIGDLKTGQSLDFSALSISVQLALYAHAETIYDLAAETHEAMPPVRQDVAYVVHLPSGQGRAEVLEVDLVTGWEAAQVCGVVRGLRAKGKRKGVVLRPRTTATAPQPVRIADALPAALEALGAPGDVFAGLPDPGQPDPLTVAVDDARNGTAPDRRAWVVARVETIKTEGHAPELIAVWPKGVPGTATDHPHTDAELDLICAALDVVDKRHSLPLDPDPANVQERLAAHLTAQRERLRAVIPPVEPGGPDEGPRLTDDDVTAIKAEIGAAPAANVALLTAWLGEANAAGHGWSITRRPSTRREGIYRAGLALADLCDGNPAETDLAHAVLTGVGAGHENSPVGVRVGRLTIEQAAAVPYFITEEIPRRGLSYDTTPPRFILQTAHSAP